MPVLLEVSSFNPAARRIDGGIWNEDVLPVTGWEIAEMRVVMPADLQTVLGFETPVLRWNREKYQSVVRQHRRDIPIIQDLSRYLAQWAYCGEETGDYEGNYRILFQDHTERWHAASIGRKQGSHNMITVFGSSKPNFRDNRLRLLRNVVKREVTLGQGG